MSILLKTSLALLIFSFMSSCVNNESDSSVSIDNSETQFQKDEPDNKLYHGIDTSLYIKLEGRVRRNQFLSEILEKYFIDYPTLDKLIRNSRDSFNVRNIKAGSRYALFLSKDSLEVLQYMILENDLLNHFILDFTADPIARKLERPLVSKLKYSSGIIESSLWNAMADHDINPLLAVELSEIYAWSIDFFGLQAGDKFKIMYQEDFVDTLSTGIGRIYGALFEHAGEKIYAIPLIQDDTESFYDLEGNSLRKAFLKAPLSYSRISSRFSNSRLHPILRIRRPHHGVDYAAAVGTPVLAIGDGRVIMAEYQSGSGRIVKVKHNSVYTTAYMHLSRYGQGIASGKYVRQGDIVGYVGSSGLSTGPHLDFRFYMNGQAIDPLKVKAPPVEPVSEDNKEKFEKISLVIKKLLDEF